MHYRPPPARPPHQTQHPPPPHSVNSSTSCTKSPFIGIHRMMRAKLLRKLPPLPTHLTHNNVLTPLPHQRLHHRQPNRPSPQHQRTIPLFIRTNRHSMPPHRQRLNQRPNLQTHIIRQLLHTALRHNHVITQPPIPPRQPHKPILIATVHHPAFAGAAVAVVDGGLHAHTVAGFEGGDVGADFFDDAGELVAEG